CPRSFRIPRDAVIEIEVGCDLPAILRESIILPRCRGYLAARCLLVGARNSEHEINGRITRGEGAGSSYRVKAIVAGAVRVIHSELLESAAKLQAVISVNPGEHVLP